MLILFGDGVGWMYLQGALCSAQRLRTSRRRLRLMRMLPVLAAENTDFCCCCRRRCSWWLLLRREHGKVVRTVTANLPKNYTRLSGEPSARPHGGAKAPVWHKRKLLTTCVRVAAAWQRLVRLSSCRRPHGAEKSEVSTQDERVAAAAAAAAAAAVVSHERARTHARAHFFAMVRGCADITASASTR